MKKILAVALVAGICALGPVNIVPIGEAHARVCKPYLIAATVERRTRIAASFQSRRKWSRRVKKLVNTKWDTWLFARDRSVRCVRIEDGFRCRAVAQPCRGAI